MINSLPVHYIFSWINLIWTTALFISPHKPDSLFLSEAEDFKLAPPIPTKWTEMCYILHSIYKLLEFTTYLLLRLHFRGGVRIQRIITNNLWFLSQSWRQHKHVFDLIAPRQWFIRWVVGKSVSTEHGDYSNYTYSGKNIIWCIQDRVESNHFPGT